MSIKGKKIATAKQAILIAKAIANTEIEAAKHHPLIAAFMRDQIVRSCQSMDNNLRSTPHQYFNSLGNTDKRKKRRHDRKVGVKVHTSRLIRIKAGKPVRPVVIDITTSEDGTTKLAVFDVGEE